jgi:hypothetical protein
LARKDQLEELNLYLENAVDQITRAQRAGRHLGIDERIDGLFSELVSLRNHIRDELMRELARGPKKLPTL